ncbi:extracellular solute-binding protein [Paenibacillus cymbidii]|uniref:extracellular solute-binding protein n=1 Tax=Paenibacillus cymbidii TaxID=1639034 RepID=UPI0010803802|nr:extracellular solute-binding protein [Paenibacillus cymbidii]
MEIKRTQMRLLGLTLGAAVVLGGCSGGGGGGGTAAGTGSPAPATPAGSAKPTAAAVDTKSYAIKVYNAGFALDRPHIPREQDPIRQMIEKKLNIDFDLTIVAQDAFNKLNVMIAGGSTPDLIWSNRAEAVKLYQQGVVATLDEALNQTPKLKALYDDKWWQGMKFEGKTIGIPSYDDISGINGWWIRNDWLKKLNLKVPTTPDELLQVLRAFTNDDPDGNGKKDTYGILVGANRGMDQLSLMFGVNPSFHDVNPPYVSLDNGKLVYDNADPRMKDALGYLNTIVKENLIDPDWVTLVDDAKFKERIFKGKVGFTLNDWRLMEPNYTKQMQDIGGSVPEWVVIPSMKGPRGDQALEVQKFQKNMWVISKEAAKDPGKLKRIMEMLEYFYTDKEIYPYLAYGVKDVHWKEEGGKIATTDAFLDPNNFWIRHYAFVRKGDDPLYFNIRNPKTNDYQAINRKYIKENPVFPYLSQDPADTLYTDRIKYVQEMNIKFITGKEPLSKWDDYVKTLESKFKLGDLMETYRKQLVQAGILK